MDAEIEKRMSDVESGKVRLLRREEFSSAFEEAREKLATQRREGAGHEGQKRQGRVTT